MSGKTSKIIVYLIVISILAVLFAVIIVLKGTDFITSNFPFGNSSSNSQIASNTESTPVIEMLESNQIEADTDTEKEKEKEKELKLELSSPSSKTITVTDKTYEFSGSCDPNEPLYINKKLIKVNSDGVFSVTYDLKEGKNTFIVKYKNKTDTYIINYNFVIIKSYSPNSNQSYASGSTAMVSVVAKVNSTVTATLYGTTITLSPQKTQNDEDEDSKNFMTYSGSFKFPSNNNSNIDLGKIKFEATLNKKSETVYSGEIICERTKIKVNYDPNAPTLGGRYVNVGTGKITEIIAYEAETFDAESVDDKSRPTNNYLPKGTVDYSASGYYYHEKGDEKKEYTLLRCGRQVYTYIQDNSTSQKISVVKEYAGTLPDHNEISIASFGTSGKHTVLTLNTLWKAPFYFDILPQAYSNPSKHNYSVSNVTSQYIDITFCYTTIFKNSLSISQNNPLFKSCKIIKGKSDYTLRLYLKKIGGFYGWDANYKENGQLVFTFLNPATVQKANNEYGVNLKGVTILLDIGHGGYDQGASGFDRKNHSEAIQNLYLAKKIATELNKTGALVYVTRSTDKTVSNSNKIRMLKSLKPDICIAIHHNSARSSSANGFDSYYFHSFSMKAASLIRKYTKSTKIYKSNDLGWHYYFMARSSYCPVVLTENGFISNTYDYKNIIDSDKNTQKAKAIVKGVAEYFLLISP